MFLEKMSIYKLLKNIIMVKTRKEGVAMLKNMKVKMSLIMGYGVTILISLIFIIVCFVAMSNQKGQYDELLAKDVAANEQILYARMNANIAARNVREKLPGQRM